MKDCKKYEKNLILKKYNLLNEMQEEAIKKHLARCPSCSIRFFQIKFVDSIIQSTPSIPAPPQLNYIIRQGKERLAGIPENIISRIFNLITL